MVWSPLAGGYLTGKYSGGGTGDGGRQIELDFPPIDRTRGEPLIGMLQSVAEKHDCNPAQIAIAWLLKRTFVSTVIIDAKRVEQLRENVKAADILLDDENMTRLDAVSRLPLEYPGWSLPGFSNRDW
jgi:aryl-alcohol dehydrogenase-like predicted oxidoreductase